MKSGKVNLLGKLKHGNKSTIDKRHIYTIAKCCGQKLVI